MLPPAQKDVFPVIVGVVGKELTVTFVTVDVALHELLSVTLTE